MAPGLDASGAGADAASGHGGSQSQEGYPQDVAAHDDSVAVGETNANGGPLEDTHRRIGCFRWLIRWREKWPRSFAIIFKVIVPLFSLIALSMAFGYWLAQIEAPEEIRKNNIAIASRESIYYASQFERLALRLGPLFCLKLSVGEKTGQLTEENVDEQIMDVLDTIYSLLYRAADNATAAAAFTNSTRDELLVEFEASNLTVINDIPKLSGFMARCGAKMDDSLEFSSVIGITEYLYQFGVSSFDITFNWIKCPPRRNATSLDEGSWAFLVDTFSVSDAKEQEDIVRARWREQHFDLFTQYYSSYRQNNMTRTEARDKAIADAFIDANGFVMTTIGYGNASPTSTEGRALVFTFGFLSILVFGAVLATAGDILTSVFQDAVRSHRRLRFLSKLWVGVLLWGTLFYVYLCVLAACVVAWKRNRVDVDLEFADAYWFSFTQSLLWASAILSSSTKPSARKI